MKNFEAYEIRFVGLKAGNHEFDYHIDKEFFELFDYDEFNSAEVDVHLVLEKKENTLILHFDIQGKVNVNCDVSNEAYDQKINGGLELLVKFGSRYEEDEELLILPYEEVILKVQQYIYEGIILSVPYKKVHPGVMDGTLKSIVLDKLEELRPDNPRTKEGDTDPRWDKLKELLNEK